MISVIICSIEQSKYAAVSSMYEQMLAGDEHELIPISDAKSLAEGYNRGIARKQPRVGLHERRVLGVAERFVKRDRSGDQCLSGHVGAEDWFWGKIVSVGIDPTYCS
jgi:hypothetical protein